VAVEEEKRMVTQLKEEKTKDSIKNSARVHRYIPLIEMQGA